MPNLTIPYRKALVTGASSGIGEVFCDALAKAGIESIVLVARSTETLEKVASRLPCDTTVLTADLTNRSDLERVKAALHDVDLLVNNAGAGSFGPFHEMDTAQQLAILDLNARAPLELTSYATKIMVSHGHGCVLNIASGMSFQPMPFMSTYAASKAFLLHWSEGINAELKGTGVRCVAVCPGTIDTNFANASDVPVDDIAGASLVTGSIDSVVSAALTAISGNRSLVIPGFSHRIVQLLSRFTPRALGLFVTAWAMARTHRKISG